MASTPASARTARTIYADIYTDDLMQLVKTTSPRLTGRVQLLVDCKGRCFGRQGVGPFVSQLLQARQAGLRVILHNASPMLRKVLRVLSLDGLFALTRPSAVSFQAAAAQ